ncbi:DUF6088 family protein [Bradyrhizobium sp. Ec3.3]|uniref:DUF6088 family protein n=1 Tax=Bradyrhizobium sp. Ec3.3 TaxID=189753 RepID=UPI0007C437A2|nr:DUF6088 family protein [Bradyrhizobium sp. Ec3.3]
MASIADRIYDRMTQDSQSTKVWTARDFADIGTRSAIDVALHRLQSNKRIRRIDHGLYDVPHTNQLTKKLSPPDYKSVIQAVARRDGSKVLVDGITAANNLGLTNAVPSKVVVWTDARVKPIKLDRMIIEFKQVAPSRLVWANRPAAQVVQALIWLRDVLSSDGDRITKRLKAILNKGDAGDRIRKDLQDNLGDLPVWLVPVVKDLLKSDTMEPDTDPSRRSTHALGIRS